MQILKFMADSPFLTFFLVLITYYCVDGVVTSICNAGRCRDCKKKHDADDEA